MARALAWAQAQADGPSSKWAQDLGLGPGSKPEMAGLITKPSAESRAMTVPSVSPLLGPVMRWIDT